METELYDRILDKLLNDADLPDRARNLVDAACQGGVALGTLLETADTPPAPLERTADRPPIPGATLRSLEVRAFRGIGPTTKLDLDPGPGLTLVIGRNGSGKSSFAEALEMLLTGDCKRWSGKPTVDWAHGWHNIHENHRALIRASFAVEGSNEVTIKRSWTDDDLTSDTLEVTTDDRELDDLAALGWNAGLAAYRPFLSYSELATLVEEPSRLYDQLESILGLEDVADARKRLGEARRARERSKKATREQLKQLLADLEALDDPRARTCHAALSGRTWKLDEVEQILAGDDDSEAVAEVAMLQRLSQLTAPSSAALADAVEGLREAVRAEAELARGSAEQAEQLARLLEQAVAACEHEAQVCPVCEQALPSGWLARARERLAEATANAKAIRAARKATKDNADSIRARIRPVPAELSRAAQSGLSSEALEVWQRWAAAPREPQGLIEHVEELALTLEDAVAQLRDEAQQQRAALHDAWRPVARALSGWLPDAQAVVDARELLKQLKSAEDWLKDVEEELRDQRFEPIAERAQQIWEMLRQESSVSLQTVELERAGRRRKVKLNVAVDDAASIALAVMSQGELNALALSLFLPRMTLPDTPFRFLVIDDPVQAMDPLKVDGLARVLADVAQTRQVVVFTHDTRLPEAVRRLQIRASIIEVLRRPSSTVETRPADDPIDRHLADARALMHNEQELGPELTARILPTFCRSAIEAACAAAIRRRRIGRGEPHEDVGRLIREAGSTNTLVALALFDDKNRGGDVLKTLTNKLDRTATTAYQAIRAGAHGKWVGSYGDLVRNAEQIARRLEAEP